MQKLKKKNFNQITTAKLDLSVMQITDSISNLLSHVNDNSASISENIDKGLAIGRSNEEKIGRIRSSYNVMKGVSGGFSKAVNNMKAREKGGPVRSGNPYIVGEKGPEIIVPDKSGQVITNNNLKALVHERNITQLNKDTSQKKVIIQPIVTNNTHTRIVNRTRTRRIR